MYRSSTIRRGCSIIAQHRGFATQAGHHHMVEITPELRRRNRIVALACVAFAGAVYTYSIRKLKDEDLKELEDVTVVNLHESGLKATKFKTLLEESAKKAEEEENEAERQIEAGADPSVAIVAAGEPGSSSSKKGEGGGWKKYVFFWRKG